MVWFSVFLILILIVLVYFHSIEKYTEPILRIRYSQGEIIVYNDKSVTLNGVSISKNGKWWPAMRIMNFPFEKINPCPDGPNPYIISFGQKSYNVGCAPISLYNDIAALASI